MENCYSNLMHDDGKGLLSLLLSLIGLNVTPTRRHMSSPGVSSCADRHEPGVCVCVCVCVLQITTSLDQIREFLCGTLLYVQQAQLCVEQSLWEVVQRCVGLLKDKDLVTVAADCHTLQVTKLGKATYKGKSLLLSGTATTLLDLDSYLIFGPQAQWI